MKKTVCIVDTVNELVDIRAKLNSAMTRIAYGSRRPFEAVRDDIDDLLEKLVPKEEETHQFR